MEQRKSNLWKPTGQKIDKENTQINKNNLADYLLVITQDDITYDFIMNLFGEFDNTCLCRPYDLLEVPEGAFSYPDDKGKSKSNKNKFVTGVGDWLFNIILRDIGLTTVLGYINGSVGNKAYSKIESALSYALIENRITTQMLAQFEDKIQWMMPFENVLSPNHTEKMITCTKIINKRKAELLKQYKTEIENGDIAVIEKIEKELLAFAKEYLKDDPCMDTIDSGAGGSFGNNFKNMYVMKGAIKDPDPNTSTPYKIVTSNYLDGMSAEDYPTIAGAGTEGAYSRGKKTENGGYWEQLIIHAYQYLVLDPPGSDCGTKRFITVDFATESIDDYMYSYVIKSNGDLELLDTSTRDKYAGKEVKLRFSSMCQSRTGICNKCAGELFYLLDMPNVGMTMSQIASTLKNKCMKGFHDSTVKTTTIDPMKAFFPFK